MFKKFKNNLKRKKKYDIENFQVYKKKSAHVIIIVQWKPSLNWKKVIKSSQQLSWNEFGWKGFVWNATKVFLLGFVWNITKVFSNVAAAKPYMLKELFKKKETGFALYHDKAFEKKIQQEKKLVSAI